MRDELFSTNYVMAFVTFTTGIVISERVVSSFVVSLFFFTCGKLVDLLVKPYLEERRRKNRKNYLLKEVKPDEVFKSSDGRD